ncbi:MAG: hypothetical protein HYZ74_07660 [Elusimicrobia bacterium]|nr:hypothetical protein [Elusimicrobiota bacterium]
MRPEKETALPRLGGPATNVGVEVQPDVKQVSAALLPSPEESVAVVPLLSSNCHWPARPEGLP